ncbi:ubiquitin carboxyl-terminal hydrolase 38 [Pelobates cultripes]|uniref:Ubiquitin carboxyl-terminal hydrolase n=1 Tax=Pelobates cultripes TaxID=61616 RepID=A0AAD1W1B9_PELCU|nr:ubiquitin carboxyl-terminal hydrolase 38 [Pelobates cultripes]
MDQATEYDIKEPKIETKDSWTQTEAKRSKNRIKSWLCKIKQKLGKLGKRSEREESPVQQDGSCCFCFLRCFKKLSVKKIFRRKKNHNSSSNQEITAVFNENSGKETEESACKETVSKNATIDSSVEQLDQNEKGNLNENATIDSSAEQLEQNEKGDINENATIDSSAEQLEQNQKGDINEELPKQSVEEIKRENIQSSQTASSSALVSHVPVRSGKSITRTGLKNLGNTCYMNSVLQSLFMATDFRSRVLSLNLKGNDSLMKKLQQLFNILAYSKREAYSPLKFFNASRPPWFSAFSQEDSSEYLRFLLNSLHEEERIEFLSSEAAANALATEVPPQESSQSTSWGKDEKTVIQHMFEGKLQTNICCQTCKNISQKTEAFTDLSLGFPPSLIDTGKKEHQEKLSVNDMFSHFLAPEILDGDNCYQCENCASLQKAKKTVQITEEPEYLILNLLRFSYDPEHHVKRKIFNPVSIPQILRLPVERSTSLDTDISGAGENKANELASVGIKGRRSTQRRVPYALNSVVVHSGATPESGHYYCYARDISLRSVKPAKSSSNVSLVQAAGGEMPTSGSESSQKPKQWLFLNDRRVTFTSQRHVLNTSLRSPEDTVYILFYKKLS